MARPWQDDLFDIDHLQKEAERYQFEAHHAATDDRRTYLTSMAKFCEALASNEKMRTWLDHAIAELKTDAPFRTSLSAP